MTVLNVYLAGDFGYRQTTDDRGRSTYQMRWVIETDDPNQPSGLVSIESQIDNPAFDTFVPAFWSTYDHNGYQDPYAYFKGGLSLYKPQPMEEPRRWFLEGTYEPLDPGQTPESATVNPVLRPAVYRLEQSAYTEVVPVDKDGKKLRNAAGQEFTERKQEEAFRDVLTVIKNYGTLQEVIDLNNTYRYSVNSVPFYGAPARHVKIDSIESGDLVTEGNYQYYAAVIRFTFNYKPWDTEYVNQGFMHLDDQGKLVRAKTEDVPERPTPEPVLLTPDGKKLGTGLEGNTISFRLRREVDYNNIGV